MSTVWTWPGATIARVIDGDSLMATLTRDIGFHGSVTFQQKLRLNRIDAWPLTSDIGRAAAARVSTFSMVPVTITTLKPYAYGDEWVCEVVADNGANLSDVLLGAGLALPYDGRTKRPTYGVTPPPWPPMP